MRVVHRGICASRDAIFGSHKSFHLLDPSNLVPRLMRSVLVNISLTERQGDRSVRKNGHLRGTGRGIYLGLEIILRRIGAHRTEKPLLITIIGALRIC